MREKMEQLIKIWRITYAPLPYDKPDEYTQGRKDAYLDAADELEALLEEKVA